MIPKFPTLEIEDDRLKWTETEWIMPKKGVGAGDMTENKMDKVPGLMKHLIDF